MLADQHAGEPLGQFSARLLLEVTADQAVLARLTEQEGHGPGVFKEAAAWVGAKVGA